jgi:hypothetical protein
MNAAVEQKKVRVSKLDAAVRQLNWDKNDRHTLPDRIPVTGGANDCMVDLIGHIGMPLRHVRYFVIPSRARNLPNLNRQEPRDSSHGSE